MQFDVSTYLGTATVFLIKWRFSRPLNMGVAYAIFPYSFRPKEINFGFVLERGGCVGMEVFVCELGPNHIPTYLSH